MWETKSSDQKQNNQMEDTAYSGEIERRGEERREKKRRGVERRGHKKREK